MVKLMIVPYISNPPIILITMAAGLISPQCENMAGNAISPVRCPFKRALKEQRPTYSHNNEEAGKKAAEIDHAGAAAVHEVLVSGGPAAQPGFGHGGEDVACEDDEQGQVVLEERGREDDEEEADGENLGGAGSVVGAEGERQRVTHEGEGDYGLEAGQGHDGL